MAPRLHKSIYLMILLALAIDFGSTLASDASTGDLPADATMASPGDAATETPITRYNDAKAIRSSKTYTATQVNIATEYYNMKAGQSTLRGMGFNLNAAHGFSPNLALGGSINQAYSPRDNYAATYLAIEIRLGYAIVGAFRTEAIELQQESWSVATIQREPTLRIEFGPHITQFFLNTKGGALPFSGFGLDLVGDYPVFRNVHANVGGSIDRLNNGNVMITRTRFTFGLGLFL